MDKNLNDNELISLIKEKGDKYYNILLNRYQKKFEIILNSVAKRIGVYFYEYDEFLLTFYVCFETALTNYDSEQNASFLRFFNIIADRRLTRELMNQRNSNDVLDSAISLDMDVGDGLKLKDIIASPDENIPENVSFESMRFSLRSATKNDKKPRIYRVIAKILLLKSEGYSTKEISKMTGLSEGQISRLIRSKKSDELRSEILKFK